MSDRIGPMAWGSQGAVFLGEDLMHTRDYSDESSRVIDEEVERILREQEERATVELKKYRAGLDKVAKALLEKETIDGAEVGRLVDEGFGRAVHGRTGVPQFGAPRPDGRPDPEATPAHGEEQAYGKVESSPDDTTEIPNDDDTVSWSRGRGQAQG